MIKQATSRLDELEEYRAQSFEKASVMDDNFAKLSQKLDIFRILREIKGHKVKKPRNPL